MKEIHSSIKKFINKKDEEIEKEFGFTHYIESKDYLLLGRNQDHDKIIDALMSFIAGRDLEIVKTDDGVVVDIFDMPFKDVEKNLMLLGHKKGVFWEEETEMCFALLGEDFFSYVFPNDIMFSANEKNAAQMAKILDSYKLEYIGPEEIGKIGEQVYKPRKLGRNEPCHCSSGTKYKKCCLQKNLKATGKLKKRERSKSAPPFPDISPLPL